MKSGFRRFFTALSFVGEKGIVIFLAGIFLLLMTVVLPIQMARHDQQNNTMLLTCAGRTMSPGDTCFYEGSSHTYQEWKAAAEQNYTNAQAASVHTIWITTSVCAAFALLCTIVGGFNFFRFYWIARKNGDK